MIIKKVLETSIDLTDPVEIYNHDINPMIIKKLTTRYKNRCFQSIYVLSIVKIIRRSSIKMTTARLDGSASIDIQFEVEGIVLIEGNILHGCKVIEIHTNAITAEHKYVGIKLQRDSSNKISQILQIGQVIPVIVKKVRYIPNQSKISMIASPYVPSITDPVVYKISSGLSMEETEKLGMFIDQIADELKLHTDTETKRYAFFKDLMYPYKVNMKYESSHQAESLGFKPVELNLTNLTKISHGLLTYPSEDNRSNNRMFWSKKTSVPGGIMVVNADMFPVVASYLNQYLTYLMALRGFVETYKTDESIKGLIAYWRMCKMSKL